MKKLQYLLYFGLFLHFFGFSQETATISQTNEVTLQLPDSYSKTLGLFVFPAKDQDAATQKEDEKKCYIWAYEQTGFDPLNPTKVQASQVDKGPDGAAVGGAARGAAAGAAIGAVTGNAGDGAAVGAIAGGIRGRRAAKYNKAKQQQANNNNASGQEKAMLDNFKKAFSACIEAKGYSVN
jgi:hypothetical protein